MRQDTFRRKTRRRFFRFFGILPLQKKSGSRRRANFSAQGGKGTQSGKPFAGAARFFSVGLCGLRFAEPPLRRADFFRTGRKRAQSGKPFAGAARFFSVWLCGLRFAEPLLRRRIFSHGAEKGRTAERRAGFGFIPKRIKRNSGNYSLASSGSKRLCRLRKSRQSGREKIAVSATCGAITV